MPTRTSPGPKPDAARIPDRSASVRRGISAIAFEPYWIVTGLPHARYFSASSSPTVYTRSTRSQSRRSRFANTRASSGLRSETIAGQSSCAWYRTGTRRAGAGPGSFLWRRARGG